MNDVRLDTGETYWRLVTDRDPCNGSCEAAECRDHATWVQIEPEGADAEYPEGMHIWHLCAVHHALVSMRDG